MGVGGGVAKKMKAATVLPICLMSIIYSLVAKGNNVLAQHASADAGNAPLVGQELVAKIAHVDGRKTYSVEGFVC